MRASFYNNRSGFTIVELLIVVVVIAILAVITTVAFNGIQNRASDSAVSSDLTNMARKIKMFYVTNNRYPQGSADMNTLDVKITKNAYSRGMFNGTSWYNVVYCWPNSTNPDQFAVVAQSKSGNTIHYSGGKVSQVGYSYASGSAALCSSAGVDISATGRDWFYDTDAWRAYAKS